MNTALLSVPIGWALVSPPVDASAQPSSVRDISDAVPTAVVAPPAPEPDQADTPPATTVHEDPPAAQEAEPPAKPWRLSNGLRLASPDGRHRLEFGFLGQLRATVRDTQSGDPSGGFAIRLARPTVAAHLWDGRVSMRLMPEFAGRTPSLLDGEVTVTAHEAFAVELGQYRPWISRGYRTGLFVVGLPGRGVIVDRFRIDRDVGVTVQGQPFGGKFEYYLGVLNGAGLGSTSLAPSPLLTARVVVAPLGAVPYSQTPYVRDVGPRSEDRDAPPLNPMAVAIGAGAYTVANRENYTLDDGSTVRTDPRRKWGAAGDVVVSRRRLFTMAEGFYEHRFGFENTDIGSEDAWAIYGQAGVLAWNPFIDVTFRSGIMSDFDRHFVPIEPGINAYLYGNHGKLQFSYRCDVDLQYGTEGCASHLGTLDLQLLF